MSSIMLRSRLAKTLTDVPAPPPSNYDPPPDVNFRGYFIGNADRSVSRITTDSKARSNALVEELTWAVAQTSQTQNTALTLTTAATDIIDAFCDILDDVANPYECGKLRLFAGKDCPDWAKALDGGPYSWTDTDGSGTISIPKWFGATFLACYDKFIHAIANYVATKTVKLVDITICGPCTTYSEPCIKQFSVAANRTLALSMGWSIAVEKAALKQCIDIHHAYMTPLGITSSFAYNPLQEINASGGYVQSMADTIEIMEYQRSLMGVYGPWANNSWGAKFTADATDPTETTVEARGGDYRSMYEYMYTNGALKGHPVYAQSMTIVKMYTTYDDARPYPTILYAIQMGALSMEGAAGSYVNATIGTKPGWGDNSHLTLEQATTSNSQFHTNADRLHGPVTPPIGLNPPPYGVMVWSATASASSWNTWLAQSWVGGCSAFMRYSALTTDGVNYNPSVFDSAASAAAAASKPWMGMVILGNFQSGLPAFIKTDPSVQFVGPFADNANHKNVAWWNPKAKLYHRAVLTYLADRYKDDPWLAGWRITGWWDDNGEPWWLNGNAGLDLYQAAWDSAFPTNTGLAAMKAAYQAYEVEIADMTAELFSTHTRVTFAAGDAIQDNDGSITDVTLPARHPARLSTWHDTLQARSYANRLMFQFNGTNATTGSSGYQAWLYKSFGPNGLYPGNAIGGQQVGGVTTGSGSPLTASEFATMISNMSNSTQKYTYIEVYGGDATAAIGSTADGVTMRNAMIAAASSWTASPN